MQGSRYKNHCKHFRRSQVGCGPTATHFLCFAKESKQRKATTLPLPFGFPIVQDKKWESVETRFAQTTPLSLSIFCLAQLAVSEVERRQSQKQGQKQGQKQ
ncbi:hypothetical protein [Undibacterium flavidum]|uniref:hypothetical protein n=1 Tax=Undibacterium flavidum TaxID=2762297 RepID=UPI001C9A5A90|nr:hypothetical protein [Undibacterium flavidum]